MSGTVSDSISGVDSLRSRIDGGKWISTNVDIAGAFSFAAQLPLDGSADGMHRFSFESEDRLGNRSRAETSFQLCASGSNCAITQDSGVQQSPSIATNPLDSNQLIMAYMDYSLVNTGYAGIGIARSSDGGVTWTHSSVPVPELFDEGAASPKVLYDHQGRVFVSFMAASFAGAERAGLTNPLFGADRIPGFESNNGIFVARSDDGGASWNEPIAVVSHVFDGIEPVLFDVNPDISVDVFPDLPNGDPNENFGNIYAAWSRVYTPGRCPTNPSAEGGIEVRFGVSRDGGLTWEVQDESERSKVRVDALVFDVCLGQPPGIGLIDVPQIRVGAEGEIYISHFGGGNFAMALSRDGGDTFKLSDFQTGQQIVFGEGFSSGVNPSGLPNNQFRTLAKRAFAPDPSRPGAIYAVEPVNVVDSVGNEVDPADILFGRSTDFGSTWETNVTVGEHPETDFECSNLDRCNPLNDDNDAQTPAGGRASDVISGQAFSQVSNGDGSFDNELVFANPNSAAAMQLVDFGSQIVQSDGSTQLGPPDGQLDVLLANHGVAQGQNVIAPEVVVLPALVDDQGEFAGLGEPIRLAGGESPQDLDVEDLDGDGRLDLVVVDREGIMVVYGQAPDVTPNTTLATARDLGAVVHLVDQVQTIVPGRMDAFYKFTVPTEAVGLGDEVIDVSLLFRHIEGPGIGAELRNEQGNLIGSGERFRARVQQGEELQLRVFGLDNGEPGYGSFQPVINILPQVVSLESQALLPGTNGNPGGPTTSIVAVLQGDRLDPSTVEDPDNYIVTFLGVDGQLGTADDQVIPITCGSVDSQCVVYNPSANVDISTGRTFPTAVRQTVTLLFEDPLPAGSYSVAFSSNIQTDPFNEDEMTLLSNDQVFMGHPLVSVNGNIQLGSQVTALDLVLASGNADITAIKAGNRFLTQLHDDLGAVLDRALTELGGDDDSITGLLADQALVRLRASLGDVGQRTTSLIAFLFDPLSPNVEDPSADEVSGDIDTGIVVNETESCYIDVQGNVQIIVCPFLIGGVYELTIDDVPETARAVVVILDNDGETVIELTDSIRMGEREFSIGSGQ